MKDTGLLIDSVYRETFRDKEYARYRDKLTNAKRFVLDSEMSSFLSDLSHEAFQADPRQQIKIVEGIRSLARLPHKTTWIEFDSRQRMKRSHEKYPEFMGFTPIDGVNDDYIKTVGWLLETLSDDTFSMTYVACADIDRGAPSPIIFPFSYVWTVGDRINVNVDQMPMSDNNHCTAATGMYNYVSPNIKLVKNPLMKLYKPDQVAGIAKEVQGELRFVFALLASINDIPVGVADVTVSKGFVGRGQYRKFLSHSVITLNVPKRKNVTRLAKMLVAISRRKAHEVRGHYKRVGPTKVRKWIAEHVRGDAMLGWVKQEYAVKYGKG